MIPVGFWTWAFFIGLPALLGALAIWILFSAEGKRREKNQPESPPPG